jgi:hypothetical protein
LVMKRRLEGAILLAFGLAGLANCSSGGDPGSCPAGSETCACYGNETCNPNLECRSHLCVASDAGSGGATGGNRATGGGSSGGSPPATGGSASASGGSADATGGSSDPSGGASACGDTSTDPENCGQCRRSCNGATCKAGVCQRSIEGCFAEDEGFTTCSEFCSSLGESCLPRACGASTFVFQSGDQLQCLDDPGNAAVLTADTCDDVFIWDPSHAYYACCCSVS